jgi:hypothetical protein
MTPIIIIIKDRQILDLLNTEYDSIQALTKEFEGEDMTHNIEYYTLDEFTTLVNDQVLDDLRGSFIGYTNILDY